MVSTDFQGKRMDSPDEVYGATGTGERIQIETQSNKYINPMHKFLYFEKCSKDNALVTVVMGIVYGKNTEGFTSYPVIPIIKAGKE